MLLCGLNQIRFFSYFVFHICHQCLERLNMRCYFRCSQAVLHTHLLFIFTLFSFSSKSSKHHYTQTVRARNLKLWENIHPNYVSYFMCHVSVVRCQAHFFRGGSGGASRWSVCYQCGLPCLVKRPRVARCV